MELANQLIHLIASLAAVIIAIFTFAYVYKKFGRGPHINNDNLKILSSLSLGAKEKLLLVQVGEEQLLLGATGQKISFLHRLEQTVGPNDD